MSVYITDGEAKGEVLSFLTEKLKFNVAAFKVVPVAAIPRNESGKVVYNDLPTA